MASSLALDLAFEARGWDGHSQPTTAPVRWHPNKYEVVPGQCDPDDKVRHFGILDWTYAGALWLNCTSDNLSPFCYNRLS
jgi:hypothetical protein